MNISQTNRLNNKTSSKEKESLNLISWMMPPVGASANECDSIAFFSSIESSPFQRTHIGAEDDHVAGTGSHPVSTSQRLVSVLLCCLARGSPQIEASGGRANQRASQSIPSSPRPRPPGRPPPAYFSCRPPSFAWSPPRPAPPRRARALALAAPGQRERGARACTCAPERRLGRPRRHLPEPR